MAARSTCVLGVVVVVSTWCLWCPLRRESAVVVETRERCVSVETGTKWGLSRGVWCVALVKATWFGQGELGDVGVWWCGVCE